MTPPSSSNLHARVSRRSFLASLAAWPLAARLPSPRQNPPTLILVWLDGGLSHVDSFDGKPDASTDVRGDLGSIAGALDGSQVSSLLPGLARRLDRTALLRSITHGEGNHDRGAHFFLTGSRPSPVLMPPSLGAIASLRRGDGDHAMPAYVAIPDAPREAGAGFLSPEHAAFAVGGDPAQREFRVRDLEPAAGQNETAALLAMLDAADGAPRSDGERARDRFVRASRALASDPALREAFALSAEPAARRERYGRHRLGQSCLLAARLSGHGARVVLVRDTGWDHHTGIARALGFGYPPKLSALDEAVSALLDDLRDGPLAGRAVVCVASEFGRTPRLNPSGGRDHWPRAQSVLLAGAGVRPGLVGRTDERGEEPVERPLSPADLFATLCHLCAVPIDVLHTPDGRPVRVVPEGASIIDEVVLP